MGLKARFEERVLSEKALERIAEFEGRIAKCRRFQSHDPARMAEAARRAALFEEYIENIKKEDLKTPEERRKELVDARVNVLKDFLERNKLAPSVAENVRGVIELYQAGDEEMCDLQRKTTVLFQGSMKVARGSEWEMMEMSVRMTREGPIWQEDPLGSFKRFGLCITRQAS